MSKFLLGITVVLALTGCRDDDWQTKDVSGLLPDLEFALQRANGEPFAHDEVTGKVALLFFGFTYCPDVCPLTLSKLAGIAKRLDVPPSELAILFVSVDPARDDLAQLSSYITAFQPHVIGLRTDDIEELNALTRRFRVTYGYGEPDESGNYDVSHSSGVFVFDRAGKMRLLVRESDEAKAIAADLERLLRE